MSICQAPRSLIVVADLRAIHGVGLARTACLAKSPHLAEDDQKRDTPVCNFIRLKHKLADSLTGSGRFCAGSVSGHQSHTLPDTNCAAPSSCYRLNSAFPCTPATQPADTEEMDAIPSTPTGAPTVWQVSEGHTGRKNKGIKRRLDPLLR